MSTKYSEEIKISAWNVSFDDAFTAEDALLASRTGVLPGENYSFTLENGGTFDLDDLRKFKAPIKSGALMLCKIYAQYDGAFTFGFGVDWWFTAFVNGESAVDLGVHGNNGTVSVFANTFRMNLKKGENIFAALTNRGGASWNFTIMPFTENIILNAGPALSTAYYKKAIRQNTGLSAAPWVFAPSVHSVKVGAVFYSEVICGIRYRKKDSSDEWTEKWTKGYGQKLPAENHIFELTGLDADSCYEYQILLLDELTPSIKIIAKDSFTTFPEKGVEHSFFALSDTQTNAFARSRLVTDFMKNCHTANTEFMASLGDIDSECTDINTVYFDTYFSVIRKHGYNKPFAIVRGNHELRGGSQHFPRLFGRTYYSFRRGDVYYFVLDTGEDKAMHAAMPHLYTVRTDLDEYLLEQKKWLMDEIKKEECRNAKYHIVLAHAAPFAWISSYYAERIALFAKDAFYGKNPECKLDLWLCGDVHCPFRFDPVSGEVYGALGKNNKIRFPYAMGEFDRENICFPVYINSGPSCSTVDFSFTRVDIRDREIELTMQDPDGNILDNTIFHKDGGMKVKSSTFFRYPLQKELEAKGEETPPRPRDRHIPWETIPFVDTVE